MLETFIITLREGIEAFLIIAITLAYLTRTNRKHLFKAVYFGIGAAILASFGLAHLIENFLNPEVAEGVLALVAGVLVLSLTVHMLKAGKAMGKTITNKLEQNADKGGFAASFGVFLFTVLMISREGFEITILMQYLSTQNDAQTLLIGALSGVLAAAAMGYAWMKYSHLINLGRFMQVTAVFLIAFSIHLLAYGFHELTESFILPFSYETNLWLHESTEFLDHDQPMGMILGYSIVVLPIAWLAVTIFRDMVNKSAKQAASA